MTSCIQAGTSDGKTSTLSLGRDGQACDHISNAASRESSGSHPREKVKCESDSSTSAWCCLAGLQCRRLIGALVRTCVIIVR